MVGEGTEGVLRIVTGVLRKYRTLWKDERSIKRKDRGEPEHLETTNKKWNEKTQFQRGVVQPKE